MIDLKGKVAVVTGGCSGIGRGTVNVLHRAGAQVACVDVQDEKGHALAKELGDGVLYVHADVTSENEVAAARVVTLPRARSPNPVESVRAVASAGFRWSRIRLARRSILERWR